MNDTGKNGEQSADTATVTLPGTVEKIIPSLNPAEPAKAEISIDGAEDLYKEIRVDNILQDHDGKPVAMKKGAEVKVTIAVDQAATTSGA